MTLQIGTVLVDRYRIVKPLNQGGFGAVYRAWDMALGRPCALKSNLDVSDEARRQFEREAKILAALSHPNLPRVSDYFFIPGQGQYLVMDYVEGQDLQDMLEQRGKPLPEAQVLPWIDQVCDALGYLHAQKPPIIHRDIKPANIQITPDGRAMLVDFGIAKLYDPGLKTTLGARAVTPGYSPHEQYGQDTTDARSDVYALGATLYTLLTGKEPPESVKRVVRDPLIPPAQLNPSLTPGTVAALKRALQVDPQQRFQQVSDFRAGLFGDRPLEGRNVPPPGTRQPAIALKPVEVKTSVPWGWIGMIALLGILLVVLGIMARATAVGSPDRVTDPSTPSNGLEGALPTPAPPTEISGVGSPTVTPTPLPLSPPQVYIVEPGETCTMIARRYGLPLNDLIAFNHLSIECAIAAGQRLLIPAEGGTAAPADIDVGSLRTQVSPVDGMELVQIPAGIFWMGAAEGDPDASGDEKPGYWVYLDAFWMDRTEVTNAMHALCVQAGGCQAPAERSSKTRLLYSSDPSYGNYPVIHVSWEDASAYCQWMGRRLPTEAEWEKAARGADGRIYPWGNAAPTASLMNYNNQVGDTTPVGSYPDGASPYGILDMAGNVREWVADWYSPGYYRLAPVANPPGPESGEFRVLRGGSWFSPARAARVSFRHYNIPDRGYDDSGFRCAR